MPIYHRRDSKGCYMQWGNHGAKYYYKAGNQKSHDEAYRRAVRQAQAAYAHGYKGHPK